jgi:threonine/homoserine/homoserine lactone efflux protein
VGSTELLGLITFGIAGSGSPGPNTTLLLASGLRFGFKRTIPHVMGAAAGVGAMVIAVAAGGGTLLDAVPGANFAVKALGSAYLLYLAIRLASKGAIEEKTTAKPLNVWEAAVFQFVNPKAWIFAIAVIAFAPPALPAFVGGLLITLILVVVMIGTFASWALGGAALSRLLTNQRAMRVVNITLAVLLVSSVALLWI